MKRLIEGLLAVTMLIGTASCLAGGKVPAEEDMAAYLMVYFSDSDHSLHMALSPDGYSFTALNDNKPVISGQIGSATGTAPSTPARQAPGDPLGQKRNFRAVADGRDPVRSGSQIRGSIYRYGCQLGGFWNSGSGVRHSDAVDWSRFARMAKHPWEVAPRLYRVVKIGA